MRMGIYQTVIPLSSYEFLFTGGSYASESFCHQCLIQFTFLYHHGVFFWQSRNELGIDLSSLQETARRAVPNTARFPRATTTSFPARAEVPVASVTVAWHPRATDRHAL